MSELNADYGNLLMRLLSVVARYEIHDEIWWNEADGVFEFFVNCNDLFAWGCADSEPIRTDDDISMLDQACKDSKFDGPQLYCARRRKMRPQVACYEHFEESTRPLFDACGPHREVSRRLATGAARKQRNQMSNELKSFPATRLERPANDLQKIVRNVKIKLEPKRLGI